MRESLLLGQRRLFQSLLGWAQGWSPCHLQAQMVASSQLLSARKSELWPRGHTSQLTGRWLEDSLHMLGTLLPDGEVTRAKGTWQSHYHSDLLRVQSCSRKLSSEQVPCE